ncbi:putative leucine--tRNA ligase, mitochondrial [Nymphon striatum]|nr:putative leucine--tRNA ligase, mitochondrial [Nymphon striatum]
MLICYLFLTTLFIFWQVNGENICIVPGFLSGNINITHFRLHCVADCLARFYRMRGKNVILPIVWDSFNQCVEKAAVADGELPDIWIKKQISDFNEQFLKYGLSFNKDLKLKKLTQSPEHEENITESTYTEILEKQWFLAVSKYSKSLLDGLKDLSTCFNIQFLQSIRLDSIGNNLGYCFGFSLTGNEDVKSDKLKVWTDQPELLYGVTYIVITQFHHLNHSKYYSNVDKNSEEIRLKVQAVHPLTQKEIPIFVCNHNDPCIIATQSYLGIPGEICADQPFAAKHILPIIKVVNNENHLINSEKHSGLDLQSASRAIVEEAIQEGYCYEASDKQRDKQISQKQSWGIPIPIIHCQNCGEIPVPRDDLPVSVPKLQKIENGFQIFNEDEWIHVKCPKCNLDAKRDDGVLHPNFDCLWSYMQGIDPHESSTTLKQTTLSSHDINIFVESIAYGKYDVSNARMINHFCNDVGLTNVREPILNLIYSAPVKANAYFTKNPTRYMRKEDLNSDNYKLIEKNTDLPVNWTLRKMCRLKCNDVSPCELLNDVSIDTARMLFFSQPATQRFLWPLSQINMKRLLTFQRGLWNTIRSFISLKENSDFEIDEKDTRKTMLKFDEESYDIRNYYLKSITHAFELHRPDLALENILRMHSGLAYLVPEIAFRCLQYEKALATLILSSFPLMPHLSSELWSRLSKVCKSIDYDMNKNIHEQKWPEVDMAYSLDLNINMADLSVLIEKRRLARSRFTKWQKLVEACQSEADSLILNKEESTKEREQSIRVANSSFSSIELIYTELTEIQKEIDYHPDNEKRLINIDEDDGETSYIRAYIKIKAKHNRFECFLKRVNKRWDGERIKEEIIGKKSNFPVTFDVLLEKIQDALQVTRSTESLPGTKTDNNKTTRVNYREYSKPSVYSLNVAKKEVVVTNESNVKCIFCGETDHESYACPEVKEMSVQGRCERVKTIGACFNCLKKGHYVSVCRSSHCKICKKNHHTLLHIEKYEPGRTESTYRNNRDKIESSAGIVKTVRGPHKILMQTSVAKLESKCAITNGRILFDSGEEKRSLTYLEKSAMEQHKHNTILIGERYETGLLHHSDYFKKKLRSNKSFAYNHLVSLEKRLHRDPALADLYKDKQIYFTDEDAEETAKISMRKKQFLPCLSVYDKTQDRNLEVYVNRFSSFYKLIRVMVLVRNWVRRYRNTKSFNGTDIQVLKVKGEDKQKETLFWIRSTQQEAFFEEINELKKSNQVSHSSKIFQLNPMWDAKEELLRVGGRLHYTNLTEETKHPIILPSHKRVVDLLVLKHHKSYLHTGPAQTFAFMRNKYWLVRGRQETRRILYQCRICREPKQFKQKIKPLPPERIIVTDVFTNVGVDFAGPLYSCTHRTRRRLNKRTSEPVNQTRELENRTREPVNRTREQENRNREQENRTRELENRNREQENRNREQENRTRELENRNREQENRNREQENRTRELENRNREQENRNREQENRTREQENRNREQENRNREQVNGKDCGYYQIKRDQLESLSSEQAIEMAFDCQYVTNAIGSQPVSTVQYTYVKQCEGRVAIETEGYISK